MKRATAMGLMTAIALSLASAAATAQPYGYRHHYYGHGSAPAWGSTGSTRGQMVQTPGN
jgi:hypothetical protein